MKVVVCDIKNKKDNSLNELSSYFQRKIENLSMKGWNICEDMDGFEMICYNDMIMDEVIHCVGELSLCRNNALLEEDYGEPVHSMALRLLDDRVFADTFYEEYLFLKDLLDAKFDDERID